MFLISEASVGRDDSGHPTRHCIIIFPRTKPAWFIQSRIIHPGRATQVASRRTPVPVCKAHRVGSKIFVKRTVVRVKTIFVKHTEVIVKHTQVIVIVKTSFVCE